LPTRRDMLRLAAALPLVGLGSAACGGGSSQVSWSVWSSSPAEEEVWNKLNVLASDKLGVPTRSLRTPSAPYVDKLQVQMVSGTPPEVADLQGLQVPTFASRQALLPLDDYIASDPDLRHSDFYPLIRQIMSYGGKTYGLGLDVGPMIMYYNRDMFRERGIPFPSPTEPLPWAEFRALAKEFTNPGKKQYGFTADPGFDSMVSFIWSAGGEFMDADQTTCTMLEPSAMDGIRYMVELFTVDKVTPPITSIANVNSIAVGNFTKGNVAFMFGGPWQVVNTRKAKFDWDVIPFPAGPAGSRARVSGSGMTIPSGVKDRDTAWQLLKILTGNEALNIYGGAGRNNPARQSSASSFKPPPQNLGIVQRILLGEIAHTHPYLTTTNWYEVQTLHQQVIPPMFLGQHSISDTIKQFKSGFDPLLAQHQANVKELGSGT
jgi:multiple sugar transport system substrate-binding protein